MNPTHQRNGATDELFYPTDYGAEFQLDLLRPGDRQELRKRLLEAMALPREQWPEHGIIDLNHVEPGKFAVFFGANGIAWAIPDANGRFRIEALGSQETLREFQRQVDAGEDVDEGEEE
ncbi:MAG TPA: hypothetical protein VFW33_16340 [Gemmataceae bacterium]|nr:hypothetical protein [Gemmataceae bacterium]